MLLYKKKTVLQLNSFWKTLNFCYPAYITTAIYKIFGSHHYQALKNDWLFDIFNFFN